ncbi:MAG: hypothetical protein KJ578_06985 [Bacteroidetes bacterium]|nr:hypothetical protein [Bacteroidota bacterium]MBU1578445.1 hypothetical protein [Bacteroidota bacterium]MBU2557505.1 hypothetical protein [Bacteroidota bacterium]
MESSDLNISLHLNFNQLVEAIRQLPRNEKLKLSRILLKETSLEEINDPVMTYLASEDVLAKDWLLAEEEEAWNDL